MTGTAIDIWYKMSMGTASQADYKIECYEW